MPTSYGELNLRTANGKAFRDLQRALKEAGDGALKREMTGAIRKAGNTRVLPALRGAALAIPDRSIAKRGDGRSLRHFIAGACQTQVTQNGVRFICNRRKMPKGTEAMPLAFEKGKFRHPVFPKPTQTRGEWTWVEQDGHPWFRVTIVQHDSYMQQVVRDAVDTTFRKLEGR